MKIFSLMPWMDWLALCTFFALWVGYAWFAKAWGKKRLSLLKLTNQVRHDWMLRATGREQRIVDGSIIQALSHTPSFFSSTAIIVIGGLSAVLGTTDKVEELMHEIPFAQATPTLVFQFKVLVLIAIFVYAFFRCSWSMREYTFVALMIGAMPHPEEFDDGSNDRATYARRAGALVAAAAESFNDGLRAYYLSFAAMAWFFSPLLWVLATVLVVGILYRREFKSEVLTILND